MSLLTGLSRSCLLVAFILFTFADAYLNVSKVANNHDDEEGITIFTSELQGKWLNSYTKTLVDDVGSFVKTKQGHFDPSTVVQGIVDLLKHEKEENGLDIEDAFYQGVEQLKTDADFVKLMTRFNEALEGKRDILTIAEGIPDFEPAPTANRLDVGLRDEVLTGETTDTENDLIRYSNYISGAGSTFGGFMAASPENIRGIVENWPDVYNFKSERLLYKLKKGIKVDVLRDENHKQVATTNIEPDLEVRARRNGVPDLQQGIVSDSFDEIKKLPDTSDKTKLTQLNTNSQKKMGSSVARGAAKKMAGKVMRRFGNFIEKGTAGFTLGQGGTDIAAGYDMIQKANDLKSRGQITDTEFNKMVRDGRLRTAQGSFGVLDGIRQIGRFVHQRAATNINKILTKPTQKITKTLIKFAPVVGSAVSIGVTASSMAKNIIAASDAGKAGLTGKEIVYGVMAGIDGITMILDAASLVTDVIFPPLSPILDLIGLALQFINGLLGFLADAVDLRSTEQKVRDEFKAYVDSEAFKNYLGSMANKYKERGFDVFKYYVDAESAEVGSHVPADTEILQKERKDIIMCLTDQAKKDYTDRNLRIALIDVTSVGKEHFGGASDDEIIAGFGADKIYGCEGDDVLFGRGGEDSIYGGPGNDYLNGGTGRDVLLGGTGDDILSCEPAVDARCEGEEGDDILELSGESIIHKRFPCSNCVQMGPEWDYDNRPEPVRGIYLDIGYTGSGSKKGRSGVTLGSSFKGWPDGFSDGIHTPAFVARMGRLEQEFVDLFDNNSPQTLSNTDEIKDKILWFLAEKDNVKYFCDGESFYSVSETSTKVARNAIQSIDAKYAVFQGDHLKYTNNQKLKALLAFAFKKSFVFDDFVKISSAPPEKSDIFTNYIPTTIIGDSNNNVIDVPYGYRDVVYTGEGNNVISIGSTINNYHNDEFSDSPFPEHFGFPSFAKYVIGGSGDNTLIIQAMTPIDGSSPNSVYGYWELRNIDSPNQDRHKHTVYMKNIRTVEVYGQRDYDTIIDAEQYDGASRFILNYVKHFKGALKGTNDVEVLPKRLSETIWITFGIFSYNTISLKYLEESNKVKTVSLDGDGQFTNGRIGLERGYVWLINANNVIGSPSCTRIGGTDDENLLYAVGGQTVLDAKDGDDTLVSARGRHTLIGGKGLDTYVIHGPEVDDYLIISISMADNGRTIICRTQMYGQWKAAEKRLEIDILEDDHADVVLKSAEIIPAEGEDAANLGTLTMDSTKKKIIYEPGSNFDSLKANTGHSIRVKYTTTGSFTKIREQHFDNQIRFETIKQLDDLTVSIEGGNLVFKDKSTPPRTVLIDEEWENKYRAKITSYLLDLMLDFARRFPVILFRKNEQEYDRVTAEDTIKFLGKHLKHLETELGQKYDTIIDSSTLPSSVGNVIDVGDGQNIVLAKTRGKTYKLGSNADGSVIVANKFTGGSGDAVVESAESRWARGVNTLVVGVGSGGVVKDKLNLHHVVVTDALPGDVRISPCDHDRSQTCMKDSRNNLIIKEWYYGGCRTLTFKKNDRTEIIMDCDEYVLGKHTGRTYNPVMITYGSERKFKLHLPFSKRDAFLKLYHDGKAALWIYIMEEDDVIDASKRNPYLSVPAGDRKPSKIDAKMLVNVIRLHFKDGIQLTDTLLSNDQICQFVIDTLKKRAPQGYTVENLDHQC